MVFIRSPRITRVGEGVEVLARRDGFPTLVRQGNVLAGTFHPEMTSRHSRATTLSRHSGQRKEEGMMDRSLSAQRRSSILWLSGVWVLPFLALFVWYLPAAAWARVIGLAIFVLLAPLPALLRMHREKDRLQNRVEQAENDAAQLKLQLEAVRSRTAQLRDELEAGGQQAKRADLLVLLGQFTAGFMHEFNNPLAIVAGRIEVLLDERKEDAALCADLEQMLKETRYMSNIATTLLQALRRERGAEIFEASAPQKALEEALAALRPSARARE